MEKQIIQTQVGQIVVFSKQVSSEKTPIIFLHGVYFDHLMWEKQLSYITDRPVIAIDMPMHGESKTNIKKAWNLDDCATMLLQILDSLKIRKVIAIGHSWGSMTILRSAVKNPERFSAVGLCNMPFKSLTKKEIRNIKWQHSALLFKKFYIQQAAKSLMGKESLAQNPELVQKLKIPMSKLSNKEIKHTDKAVRIDAPDATPLIKKLTLPAIALVGKDDYVGMPPITETAVVKGGHVSPLESPDAVQQFIMNVIALTDKK